MKKEIRNKVKWYYQEKLKKHGAVPRGVDWNSQGSQELRFEQLSKIIALDNRFSVLDYGCGYGTFYDYLSSRYSDFNYYGFDISDSMIASAKERTGKNCFFSNQDKLLPVDYLAASGIFNVKLDVSGKQWLQYILETLNQFNDLTQKGFAFNLLTKYSDDEHMKDNLFYADPLFLFDYCKQKFSRYITLLHDYPLYEFTILVKKEGYEKER